MIAFFQKYNYEIPKPKPCFRAFKSLGTMGFKVLCVDYNLNHTNMIVKILQMFHYSVNSEEISDLKYLQLH